MPNSAPPIPPRQLAGDIKLDARSGFHARPMSELTPLSPSECAEVLATQRLCVLSTSDDGQPYAVPMFYGWDGETMYVGISEGRKTSVLDTNPRLCVTVTEVGASDSWRSVLVTGRAAWVTDDAERARAIEVLMAHNRRSREAAGQPQPAAASRPRHHGTGRMLRIAGAVITGRARR